MTKKIEEIESYISVFQELRTINDEVLEDYLKKTKYFEFIHLLSNVEWAMFVDENGENNINEIKENIQKCIDFAVENSIIEYCDPTILKQNIVLILK